jgi:folate-binding protein YgfZ
MGYRHFLPSNHSRDDISASANEYLLHRYTLGIPEGGNDFPPGILLPQESNLDLLNALNYQKGCYVGQELVIRVHHTGVVRKRVVPIRFEGEAVMGDVVDGETKKVGKVVSVYQNQGLALIKLDTLTKDLQVMSTPIKVLPSVLLQKPDAK